MQSLQKINVILTIALFPFTVISIIYKDNNNTIWENNYIFYGLWIFYSFILLLTLWPFITKFFKWFKFWIGLDVIIEYQNGHLEIIDSKGKKAYYYEESEFKRTLFGRRENHRGEVEIDGYFDDFIHQYNCFANLSNDRKNVEIVYGFYRRDEKKQLLHNDQRHFGYSLTLNNSFLKEKEYWEIHSNQYTRLYNVKISFPKDRPPKNAELIEIIKNKKAKKKKKKLSITPLIIRKYDRVMIKVKLLDLKEGKKVRICWEW